ncbi:MAG: archaeosine biosynthesis radical SAM protein RaSEA [Methanoculleaceae archaeon]
MKSVATEKPLACWTGMDRFAGEEVPALTIIFRTGGCRWNRCTMCGYRHERLDVRDRAELVRHLEAQLEWVRQRHGTTTCELVKIYTSGSFFDPGEVPPVFRRSVADHFRGKAVIVETRPEFVDKDVLYEFRSMVDDGTRDVPLTIAIGLETTDDHIRSRCINKGFTYDDYLAAVRVAREAGAGIKTYLLHKPPYLTEGEAIEDMLRSIRQVAGISDMISMNPCTVQRHTLTERLWRRGAYRPPYLWSVLEILLSAPIHVTCDPVGGGKIRGPHNCGACDGEIVRAIKTYSLTADRELLKAVQEIPCTCREEWEFVRKYEIPAAMPLTR